MIVRRAAAALLLALACGAAGATSLRFCDRPARLDNEQQDRLFRVAALLRDELEASGAPMALVARSGQDLRRFGQRYSHAGISLRDSTNTPWSVRQLYFACDESKPRIFDQGISGFVIGADNPDGGYLSVLLLPPDAAAALAARALDNGYALALLGPTYSANAYPFSTLYQNCNQWLVELLAGTLGALDPGEGALRERAQAWLQAEGYEPTLFDASSLLLTLLQPFVPWVHGDDHPAGEREARQYRVSMPASIERFVQAQLPGAQRIELCHRAGLAVVRRGWQPIADGCEPGPGDRVVQLDG